MEIIARLYSELKLLNSNENLTREELYNLKGLLLIGSQTLTVLDKDRESLVSQNSTVEQLIQEIYQQIEFQKNVKDNLNKTFQIYALLNKFISNAEPSDIQQKERVNLLQLEYNKLLEQYEKSPAYQKILEADADIKDLDEKLNAKRQGIMKLETEKEY